jgi:hypothetical protein
MITMQPRQVVNVPFKRLATASTTYKRIASCFWDTIYAVTPLYLCTTFVICLYAPEQDFVLVKFKHLINLL